MVDRRLVRFVSLGAVVTAVALSAGNSSASAADRTCRVTQPNGNLPTAGYPPKKLTSFDYGNGSLWIALWWPPRGILAGIGPDGGSEATIEPDGSIHAKLGWYRGVSGKLVIRGRRLDAAAPPLRSIVPDGYGPRGFQATGLIFPTVGCWQVTGTVGQASLTFEVKVSKRRPRLSRSA